MLTPRYKTEPAYTPDYGEFATCAEESAYPELWNGLVGAWYPMLGVSGNKLPDAVGNRNLVGPCAQSLGYTIFTGSQRLVGGPLPAGMSEITVVAKTQTSPGATGFGAVVGTSGTWSVFGLIHGWNDGTSIYWMLPINGTTQTVTGTLPAGWSKLSAVWKSGVKAKIRSGSNTWSASTAYTGTLIFDAGIAIGAMASYTVASFDVAYVMVWNRALSDLEVDIVHADPPAPFRRRASADQPLDAMIPLPLLAGRSA